MLCGVVSSDGLKQLIRIKFSLNLKSTELLIPKDPEALWIQMLSMFGNSSYNSAIETQVSGKSSYNGNGVELRAIYIKEGKKNPAEDHSGPNTLPCIYVIFSRYKYIFATRIFPLVPTVCL